MLWQYVAILESLSGACLVVLLQSFGQMTLGALGISRVVKLPPSKVFPSPVWVCVPHHVLRARMSTIFVPLPFHWCRPKTLYENFWNDEHPHVFAAHHMHHFRAQQQFSPFVGCNSNLPNSL